MLHIHRLLRRKREEFAILYQLQCLVGAGAFRRSGAARAMLGGTRTKGGTGEESHERRRKGAGDRGDRLRRRGGRPRADRARRNTSCCWRAKTRRAAMSRGSTPRSSIGDLRDAASLAPRLARASTGSTMSPPTTGCGRPTPTRSSKPIAPAIANIMAAALARRGQPHRLYAPRWRRSSSTANGRPVDETSPASAASRRSAPTRRARPSPSGWSRKWWRSRACRR